VYGGTFQAHDNLSVIEPPNDGDFPRGPALAILAFPGDPAHPGFPASLTVVSPGDGRHVDFVEDGPVTTVSLVDAERTVGGLLSSCTGCLPDLRARPTTLDFPHVAADGFYGDGTTPSHVDAAGSFTLVPPARVTFADLAALRVVDPGFAPNGQGDQVLTVTGSEYEQLPAQPGMLACSLRSDYTLDAWVHEDDLARHGTKDIRIVDTSTCCAASAVPESGMRCMPLAAARAITTGTGNRATLSMRSDLVLAPELVRRTLAVTYDDAIRFFHEAGSARAVLVVHTAGTPGDVARTYAVDLVPRSDAPFTGPYAGEVELPDANTITLVELAFSDETGGTWDSNESRNYRVTF
jgi:hypothetical protein